MCCQTHTPAYVYKGSLLVQAEEEAFRCQCPCLGCPRRATGEDQRCDPCRDPAAAFDGMSPWGRAAVSDFYGQAGSMRFGDYRRLLREAGSPRTSATSPSRSRRARRWTGACRRACPRRRRPSPCAGCRPAGWSASGG